MSEHIKIIEVSGFDLRALDVAADGQHIPYVNRVSWDSTTLTVEQGTRASIPGLELWVLPGAELVEDSWTSRFRIVAQSSNLTCNCPALFRIEVDRRV